MKIKIFDILSPHQITDTKERSPIRTTQVPTKHQAPSSPSPRRQSKSIPRDPLESSGGSEARTGELSSRNKSEQILRQRRTRQRLSTSLYGINQSAYTLSLPRSAGG